MGAPESNTTNIYGIHLRESANDGSDFSNGAADYRVVFLGEDGSLHAKDSAGTVTTLSGATDHGALTGLTDDDHTQYLKETDVAAKGDIYVASANDTVGVLSVGSNNQVLTADSAQSLGVKWATPSGSAAPTPFAWVPLTGVNNIATASVGAANRAVIIPAYLVADATITGFRLRVGNSTGNISVGIYNSSLSRVATSGDVACPASGLATVSFTGNYSATAGSFYFGLSASSNSATFILSSSSSTAGPLTAFFMETAHPLPSTFTSAGASPIIPSMVGLVNGGWTP